MKVLVVDDESLARERLVVLLATIDGAEVAGEAGNGRDALQAVVRLRPDVVLLDIRMPVMDGLEAARHLGLLEKPPAIVFCTAFEDHALAGGYGSAVMELYAERQITTPIVRIGWPDQFIEHGSKVDELRAKYGLTAESAVAQVRAVLSGAPAATSVPVVA